jgi:hypothetical protein
MAAKKREVKKTPFLIMVRQQDWEEGMYRLLPSNIFEKTLFASKAKMEVLEANGIVLADEVKRLGTLRVCVVNFTETTDYEPDIGYRQQEKDSMEVIPLGDVTLSEGEGEASSEVELDDEEATALEEEAPDGAAELPPGESELHPDHEPLVPEGSGDETGEDVASLLPLSEPADPESPSDSLSDQAEPSDSSGSALPEEPATPGAETTPDEDDTTFWSNLPGAEDVEPGVVQPSEPPPPVPQGGGKVSADDIVI